MVIPENTWAQKRDDVVKYDVDVFVMGDESISAVIGRIVEALPDAFDEKKYNANATFRLWEIIVLGLLAILIIFNIVMVVVVSIKIFKAIKKRA